MGPKARSDSERGFAPRASRETIRGNRRNAHEKSGTAFRQAQTRGDVHCVHLHPAHVCGTAAVQYHSLHSEYPLQLSEDGTFGEGTFIGLKNYQDLLKDDTFWLALQNTVFYAVVGVPLVIIFSIFLAHQINKKIRGRTIYRTLLFIPAITIPAAIGILWRWILNYQYGIFNWILEKLGFSRISWLGDVKYVRWAIILVVVWSMVSYYVIIMLAAMQGIDSSYYEAARLDGASSRQVFFKITLPMLTPMIFFSVIMVTIGILQIFDFIYLMVDRQTLSYTYSMSLVTYFYECAFNKSSMRGYGAAISVVLAAIIMVITMIQMVGKKYWVRSGE